MFGIIILLFSNLLTITLIHNLVVLSITSEFFVFKKSLIWHEDFNFVAVVEWVLNIPMIDDGLVIIKKY